MNETAQYYISREESQRKGGGGLIVACVHHAFQDLQKGEVKKENRRSMYDAGEPIRVDALLLVCVLQNIGQNWERK